MTTNPNGLRMAEMEANFRDLSNARPMEGACVFCSATFTGSAGEVLAAQIEHRRQHGVKRQSRRGSRNLKSFRPVSLSEDDRDEIEAEIARRRKLLGIGDAA